MERASSDSTSPGSLVAVIDGDEVGRLGRGVEHCGLHVRQRAREAFVPECLEKKHDLASLQAEHDLALQVCVLRFKKDMSRRMGQKAAPGG